MSLEKTFEIKSQQLAEKKQSEVQIAETKRLSDIHEKISNLEGEKNNINYSYNSLQELDGLQKNQVQDYLKTKEKINALLKTHSEALAEEGIKTKKDVVLAYPQEEEVEVHQQANQRLKTTAKKILAERDNLKNQGIENVRGKELKPEIENKVGGFDKKIKELKLQTPEGQDERKNEFKNGIKNELERKYYTYSSDFNRGIDEKTLLSVGFVKEAKNFGENGEKIVKETINEVFQENNENIKLLRKIDQELSLFNDFEEIIDGHPSLSDKIGKIRDLTENLPKVLAREFERNSTLLDDCRVYFGTRNPETILNNSFLSGLSAKRGVKDWLSTTAGLCQNGKDFIKSDYSRWDYGVPNAKVLDEDTNKMLGLFKNLEGNFSEELSLYMKNRYGNKESTSSKLMELYDKKLDDYEYKPSQGIKSLVRQEGFKEAKKKTQEKVKKMEAKLLAKIDFDWLKAEKDLFKDETEVWKIEDNKNKIDQEKKLANDFLNNFSDIENNLKGRSEEKIRYEKLKESWREEKDFFYSPSERENLKRLQEQRGKNRTELENTSKRKREMENKGASIFKKKAWQTEIDGLEKKEKDLKKEDELLIKEQKEEQERENNLSGINKILQTFSLGQEFFNKEMTLGEVIKTLHDKLKFIQSKEGLSPEEQVIYKDWQILEGKVKEAEDKYQKVKQEAPDF